MKVALAQINPTVGDIDGNTRKIVEHIVAATRGGAHLVVFPELAVFGYPPKDLVLRENLVRRNVAAMGAIAGKCTHIAAVVGYVQPDPGPGKGIRNAAAVCQDGEIKASYAKMLLPAYDVFDETRYFSAGIKAEPIAINLDGEKIPVGVTICEDLWNDRQFEGRRVYGLDPIQATVDAGARLLVNLSASPYRVGVQRQREAIFAQQVRLHGIPLVCVNQIGGDDDLIFDGAGLVLDATGAVAARAKAFAEDLIIVDLDRPREDQVQPYPDRLTEIRLALVVGIRDYIEKCGFDAVVVGLSGGIDSALTVALAVEAIGPARVHGVAMPSRYSSPHSLEDARALADKLGIDLKVISIEPAIRAMGASLAEHFFGLAQDVAEENIQARIRGNLLMALSNKFGWLLLTTGNKSELAVGYCTLYGDMCGGLAVLSDVPKTTVYELARHINRESAVPPIPQRTIERAPTAELRENQCDQDSLPPYSTLDGILELYVEQDRSIEDIVARGYERTTVEEVTRMVDRNEYKRKQTPVGLKVTSRAFGTGRRMPIAARFQ